MSSLHRDSRGKSPFWIGAYTDQHNRQVKRSTKSTDKRVAKTIVEGWERAEQLARNGTLTEQTARDILNEILQRNGQNQIYSPSIKQYLSDWMARDNTALDKKQLVSRLFLESLNGRDNIPLTHVTENDIVSFRNQLIAKGRTPSTANGLVRAWLGQPFRYALDKGYIRVNPVAGLKKPKHVRKVQKGTFSPEQIARLVAAATGDWKGMILFGFFTGQRLSDLANLTWKSVQLDEGVLRLEQRKTGSQVIIPLRDELQHYLESLPSQDSNDAPVFPTLYGRGTGGEYGLSTAFTRIMKAAGITSAALRERTDGVSRSVNALTFHSLRHSFNSALANAGVPQELRMKLTGHASKEMNAVYSHHEMQTIRRALNQLPKLV